MEKSLLSFIQSIHPKLATIIVIMVIMVIVIVVIVVVIIKFLLLLNMKVAAFHWEKGKTEYKNRIINKFIN